MSINKPNKPKRLIRVQRILDEFNIDKKEFIETVAKVSNKKYTKKATVTSRDIYDKVKEYYKRHWKPLRNKKGQFIKGSSKGKVQNTKNAGRKTVMTQETLQDLKKAFAWSFSDEEACLYAKISTSTLYNYCKKDPDFAKQKELLKKQPNLKAKINWINEIQKENYTASKERLERKSSNEFSTKTNMTHAWVVNIKDEEDEAVSTILKQLGINEEDS